MKSAELGGISNYIHIHFTFIIYIYLILLMDIVSNTSYSSAFIELTFLHFMIDCIATMARNGCRFLY